MTGRADGPGARAFDAHAVTQLVCQLAARLVRDGGAIITFSSSQTRIQSPAYGPYIASKEAVEGMTLVLARELRGRDVTVNAVAPGPTATPLFFEGKTQELIDRIAALAPLNRLAAPEDIAGIVSFLAGPASRWINGQVIFANGGAA
jgi:3-oxoacyl-[acyl-carrier protein] reductase